MAKKLKKADDKGDEYGEHYNESKASKSCKAKKDWVLFQNDYHKTIKKGDDLSDVPEKLKACLRTEGVL